MNSPILPRFICVVRTWPVMFAMGLGCFVHTIPAQSSFNDGIPDSWRLQYFGTNFATDPRALATADPDGDGANNFQEYLGGTDPLNALSIPSVPLLVTTFAGSLAGSSNGFRTNATFTSPSGMAVDALGRYWVTENTALTFNGSDPAPNRIRLIDTNGMVSFLAGGDLPGLVDGPPDQARFSGAGELAFDTFGNAYVIDTHNHRIRKVDTNWQVSTFAGSTQGYRDGDATNAQFNLPFGLALDASNNVYVADFGNYRVRKITPQGQVSTLAGGASGYLDGDVATARFNSPNDVALAPDGTLFVSDWVNGKVRKISTNGMVSTFGSGFTYTETVSLDSQGNVYVNDGGPPPGLYKFSGNGALLWQFKNPVGLQDGPVAVARFQNTTRPLILSDQSLLVIDWRNNRIRQITVGVPPLLTINPKGGLFTNALIVTFTNFVTNGVLRYTTDGTAPTTSSLAYTGPILLTAAAKVKARAFINSSPVSDVAMETYSRVYALANDGIPTSWRQLYFGSSYLTDPRAAADADPDGDGANNLQEYTLGTDPLDPNSGFRVAIGLVPSIQWNSVSNTVYQIRRKDSVTSTNWTTVLSGFRATNSVSIFVDMGATAPAGFYVVEPLP